MSGQLPSRQILVEPAGSGGNSRLWTVQMLGCFRVNRHGKIVETTPRWIRHPDMARMSTSAAKGKRAGQRRRHRRK